MPNNETTTSFKVDISELKKAMQDAKRSISVANSEFKAVSSACDDWTKSSDGLSAKLKQLDSNLKSQKTILNSLEAQYEAVAAEQGEGSAAADRLKIAINNQKAAINKTESEISKYSDALTEVSKAEKVATKTGQDVSDVLENVKDGADNAGDGFTVLKGAVATFAGNVLTSLVGGLKDAAVNLLNLSNETKEYRDQMSKLSAAGTEAGYSTDYVKQKYTDLYGVLADETATTTTISNFAAMGASEETLNSLLNSSIGIWAKYGDSIPLDGLAESINETTKVGQVTGGLADALNWAGISEDDFNAKLQACTSEQERQNLVADTLNSVYGDLSKSYQDANKSVIDANKSQAEYTDTMAKLGEKVEPITTALKDGFNGLLKEMLKLVENVDMSKFTSKIEGGFAVLKDDVLPAVKDGLGWIIKNKDALIAGLAGIAAGFVAFKVASLIMTVVNAFQAFKLANEGATIAQWAMNAAMNANPIMLIVTLLAAVVTAIITFIATNDDARAKFTAIWEGITSFFFKAVDGIVKFFTETIPEVFSNAIAWVKENFDALLLIMINPFAGLFKYFYENNTKFKEFVDNAVNYIKQLPSKVWTWLQNTISKVTSWRNNMVLKAKETGSKFISAVVEYVKKLPSKVWQWLKNTIEKVTTWGKNLKEKGKKAAGDLFDAIVDKVKKIPDKLKSIGSDIVKGLWNGIKNMTSWIKDKIEGFGEDVLDGLKDFFGIKSPSRLMRDEVGRWIPEGIAVGIDKNAKSVLSSMRDLTYNSVGAARAGISSTTTGTVTGGVVNNFYQTNNSPKPLSRLELYRQTKNLLVYSGGV